MKNLKIFLNCPNLFFSRISPSNKTLGVVSANKLGPLTVSGNENEPVGALLSWGSPTGGSTSPRGYHSNQLPRCSHRTIKEYSLDETGTHRFVIAKQTRVNPWGTRSYTSDSIRKDFGLLITNDAINAALMDNIPGLAQKLSEFAYRTHGCWLPTDATNPGNRHNSVNNLPKELVDVTDLIGESEANNANQALTELFDKLTSNDEKNWLNEWEIKTHQLLGFYETPIAHIYRPRKEGDPVAVQGQGDQDELPVAQTEAVKFRSWESRSNRAEIGQDPMQVASKVTNHNGIFMSDFNVEIKETFSEEDYRIFAVCDWQKYSYSNDCKMVKNTRRAGYGIKPPKKVKRHEKYKLYMPRITGFVLELNKPAKGDEHTLSTVNQYNQRIYNRNEKYELKEIVRVADRTKKRSVKGGYRGGYQGIERLSFNGQVLLEHVLVSGLQQFAKGSPIRDFKVSSLADGKRIPLSLEQYQKIERPEVEVKPIEVGHLRLYRLSNPPKRQVSADILSDLLLPSMPALLIATDVDIRVVSNKDTYMNGENCSGNCAKGGVEVTIPPGLFLVDRQEKCALGHDPGRVEYTAGFGDICNEIITIRRLLSQLNVFYDEYRANMVGKDTVHNSLNTMDVTDNSAFLGRL
mgnify:CR=1 FL=1